MELRVILHAPTAGGLSRARANARNLRAAAPDAEIEIVANGKAAEPALAGGDRQTDPFVLICANSLRARQIAVPGTARTIPAAVVHIARRQAEGWAYIRT